MSIFKQQFSKHVRDQLAIRQKVIASGNKDKNSHSRLQGFENLVPGAWYGYQQKQCVIRMASLVDLMKDIGLDLSVTNPDGTRYVTPFNSYKGSTFARNYVLEGGVLSDYARNVGQTEEGNTIVKVRPYDVRGGFPHAGKRVNLTYGDPSLVSDPTPDGYGAVPMPGIIDANVRTKSAYGSLREAKVNFVCHNMRQLEILELLYMRPGYPVCLEWGWSPYIGNDGTIINDFPSITNYEEFWNDKKITQEWCYSEIIRLKRETGGNYDGFVGFVTNFNYTARPDGGFDCSTELISMGECLDSLKAPANGFANYPLVQTNDDAEEDEDIGIYQNSLGVIIWDLLQISRHESYLKMETAEGGISFSEWVNLGLKGYWGSTVGEEGNYLEGIWTNLIDILGAEVVKQAIIPQGVTITDGNSNITTTKPFVRWDALVELINYQVIPHTEKDTPTVILSCDEIVTDDNGATYLKPIQYSQFRDWNNAMMDVSCDSDICILPHQFANFKDTATQVGFWGRVGYGIAAIGIATPTLLAWGMNELTISDQYSQERILEGSTQDFRGYLEAALTGETDILENDSGKNILLNDEVSETRIGNIFLNIDFLNETYKSVFSSKDATLGDFLKKIWDKVNEACPLHNFVLKTDAERNNIVQVIDLPTDQNELESLNYNDLFQLNVLSNDTVVREFKYNTQIPSALKATIAINAQSGHTAEDLEAVTFAAFNENIKSRLHALDEKFTSNAEEQATRIRRRRFEKVERQRDLQESIRRYNNNFFNTLEDEVSDESLQSIFDGIKGIIKEAQSIERYLAKTDGAGLKNQAIIPLNLNLVLDGISGIIIGNIFRVDESRLPKDYREGRVSFVVLGEDQNMTAGQDWTTNIRGQLFLFPIPQTFRPDRIPITAEDLAEAYEVAEFDDIIDPRFLGAPQGDIDPFAPPGYNVYIPPIDNPNNNAGLIAGRDALRGLRADIIQMDAEGRWVVTDNDGIITSGEASLIQEMENNGVELTDQEQSLLDKYREASQDPNFEPDQVEFESFNSFIRTGPSNPVYNQNQ